MLVRMIILKKKVVTLNVFMFVDCILKNICDAGYTYVVVNHPVVSL